MTIDRRDLLRGAALSLVAAVWLTPGRAAALASDEAASFVEATIKEVAELLDSEADSSAKAKRLREIMERRGAMPEIARFVAGTSWRGMSEDQQARFVEAFTGFVSTVYARRFEEYAGQARTNGLFSMDEVTDAGRKGMLVRTLINRVNEPPIVVDWLVTDRPGKIVISDIVIEGVSLLVTQREEIGSMLEARNGDVDKLIDHLASA